MSNFQVRHLGSSSSSRNSDLNLDVNVTHLGTVTPRKFDQLLDVDMTGVADGNLVSYNATTKTFVPYVGSGSVPLNLSLLSLNVSGITTLGGVRVSNGIVTSVNPGITTVVYYGDGSKLTGISGISTSTGSSIRWSIDSGISYIGRAPGGTSTSSPGWFVTRITPSPFSTATATGIWNNYLSLVYT